MLEAIEEVHDKGYIHRDVKASNFWVGKITKSVTEISPPKEVSNEDSTNLFIRLILSTSYQSLKQQNINVFLTIHSV